MQHDVSLKQRWEQWEKHRSLTTISGVTTPIFYSFTEQLLNVGSV